MKLAFVFDTRFIEYQGDYYSINLSTEFWNKRYLCLFEDIVVVGRKISVAEDPSGRLVKSNSENIHFCCLEDKGNINRLLTQKQQNDFIFESIKDCDCAICRGWWGISVCQKLSIPYMVEVVNDIWDSYWYHSYLGKVVALPNYLLQKKAIDEAPYVLYVTQSFLQRRYPTKGKAVGVSDVNLEVENDEDDKKIIQERIERIRRHSTKLVLGTAGAISVKYKGQQYVIRALGKLKKQGISNIEYQLAGKGDSSYLLYEAKKQGVIDQVKFIGSIPHNKMLDWYDSLDLYIQPSMCEGLPRAIVEAMSRALPCIGSNAGGIPELLNEEYIYDKRKSIVKQLVRLIGNLDDDKLIDMMEMSFEKSKLFKAEYLDCKRQEFLRDFCEYAASVEK